jgi:hypothetical protein
MISIALSICLLMAMFPGTENNANIYMTRHAEITLFSEAPLENIEAISDDGYGVINMLTGELRFGVPIRSFEFRKSLMKEHFNENYMESDKYPAAEFKGIIAMPDISGDGEYEVRVTGDLKVHGVTRRRTLSGKLKLIQGKLEIMSVFEVKCRDHDIKIPSLVFRNIAETIKVTIKGTFRNIT